MLDQFFSAENFRKILDYENRKGLNLERKYFPNVFRITQEISLINTSIRQCKNDDILRLKAEKITKKEQKEKLLLEELESICSSVTSKGFKFNLTKKEIEDGKALYLIPDLAANFFAMKQLQQNISKLYKVKQSNRSTIVTQLKCILNDSFPKFVLRTDIKDFYESIPHDKLLNKIYEDSLLSFFSKRIITKLLNDYKEKSSNSTGVPRGVGISAYLSELYMRKVDDSIRLLPDIIFYARYVDDIVMVFSPNSQLRKIDYKEVIKTIIEEENGLILNPGKTFFHDLQHPEACQLEYLGYKIFFGLGSIKVKLTNNKVLKYKQRINVTIKAYNNFKKIDEKKARKIFIKRLRFLTGNTRLISFTKNVLVGVFYSNNLLTEIEQLAGLDKYLTHQINSLITSNTLIQRTRSYSFEKGFTEKRYSVFAPSDLSEIVKIWKKL